MPINQEEIKNTKREIENLKKQIEDLKIELTSKLEELRNFIKEHRHQGFESVPIELIIQTAPFVDAKAYKAGGTAGVSSGTFTSNDTPNKTITVKQGIITNIA